jgi:predicted nuclease of predicted toxin-antitoxin system
MKLVIDMNLSPDWAPALRAIDIEAVHWTTIGPDGASDEAIMAWARANDAIVLTRDLDFGAMLTIQGLTAPSVIQLRIDQARRGVPPWPRAAHADAASKASRTGRYRHSRRAASEGSHPRHRR